MSRAYKKLYDSALDFLTDEDPVLNGRCDFNDWLNMGGERQDFGVNCFLNSPIPEFTSECYISTENNQGVGKIISQKVKEFGIFVKNASTSNSARFHKHLIENL